MNSEVVADSGFFTDAVQSDPSSGRVGDVVMKIVAGRPTGHRALFDAIDEAARFRFLQQRHEAFGKVQKILIHAEPLIAPYEATHRIYAQQLCGIKNAPHEIVFLLSDLRIVVQHIIEVRDIGKSYVVLLQRGKHTVGAALVERLAQINRRLGCT